FLARAWTRFRRHRVRIALTGLIVVLTGLLLGGGFVLEQDRRSARQELAQKEKRQRGQRRADLLRELELLHRTPPTVRYLDRIGWSAQAWRAAREAAEIRIDADLRDQAAAT